MYHKKQKRKGVTRSVMYCPYCGGRTELRSADGIYRNNHDRTMLYVCKNYPTCDAYVRVIPGTTEPMGSLANGHLRAMRTEAHRYFNQLYTKGIMTRSEAYRWLSTVIGLPMAKAHIGDMGEYYCELVIQESKKLLEAHKGKGKHASSRKRKYGYYLNRHRGGHGNDFDSRAAACG